MVQDQLNGSRLLTKKKWKLLTNRSIAINAMVIMIMIDDDDNDDNE